jgi:hypothetical protein
MNSLGRTQTRSVGKLEHFGFPLTRDDSDRASGMVHSLMRIGTEREGSLEALHCVSVSLCTEEIGCNN